MGDVRPNLRFVVKYLATKPKKFKILLDPLPINQSDFTLIDLGSGKGRTLLLAQNYRFHELIGVEVVPRLYEIARSNLEICHCPGEIMCMDATQYDFPDYPLVIQACNPFHTKPMREMVNHLEQSLSQHLHPVYIIYWNAFHLGALNETSLFERVAYPRGEFAIFKFL